MSEAENSERGRPKRCSSSKLKKLELLQRIKSGKKNKYDIGELENVYEEVDEREYTKKVLERQEDDWIVDDGGCGYIEDGREIFDDDLDEASIKQSKNVVTGRKRGRDFLSDRKSGNIQNLLVNMPSKKKKKEVLVKLEDDDILGDIIGEIDSGLTVTAKKQLNKIDDSSAAKDYLKSLGNIKSNKPKMSSVNVSSRLNSSPKTSTPEVNKRLNSVEKTQPSLFSPICPKEPPVMKEDVPLPLKIKEEPIEINDDYGEISVDMFGDAFDEADIVMNENKSVCIEASDKFETPSVVKVKVEPLSPEKLIEPAETQNDKEEIGEEWTVVNDEVDSAIPYLNIDKSKLPLTQNDKGQEVLRFFYWDAHEEMFSQPGTVYLFGKVWIESAKAYVSCCVAVKNIERRIFLLPREQRLNLKTNESFGKPLTMADVYEEFNSKISDKYKIKQFKSRVTTKKYVFGGENIPLESEYLEVRYSANYPALPSDLKGETFSHVFGTRASFLEILVLEKGIKGPCWIEISNAEPVPAPFSWCKVEAACTKVNNLNVIKSGLTEIPPLVIATLHPQAVQNPKTKQNEIIAVGCLVNTSYFIDKPPPARHFNQHFCVYSRPSDVTWPYDLKEALSNFKKTSLEKIDSERALLNLLLTKLYRIDPDIIVGHDLTGFGIELLFRRLVFHKVPNWSRFGRLKRSTVPNSKFKSQFERTVLTGRLLCDIKVSAKELIRARSFDLDSLCQNVLNLPENKRQELTDEEFKSCYFSGGNLVKALWWLMTDASYIIRIFYELNILPLALQITNIAGNVMSRTLMGGRSERNEFLLLHAFHSKDYIVPEKEFKKNNYKEEDDLELGMEVSAPPKSSKKKPSYAGGLVLDPKVGFYHDFILLMDFNSLYPSIIQEYNVCFTTIQASAIEMTEDFSDTYHKYLPDDTVENGILPTEIRKLVESRKDVKKLLKSATSPELRAQYDIRQMALKLTANSMYGCLGFSNSRFCAKGLAAIVTAKGREILLATKRMVEGFGYEVIYGDTDSIMINTKTKDFDQVYQVGRKIKTEVNKCYRQVELDIDGVFKYMLLLKKKKYAAVTISKLPNGEIVEKKEMKGLDIVRRDWSQLAAAAGRFILNEILSNKSNDDRIEGIHNYLGKIRTDLEEGKVPLPLLTVTKQLTKAPEEYSDPKTLPHVQVALRLNKNSAKRLKQGDTVSYIICQDGTNNPATQRAYHIDELKSNKDLKIDVLYYLEQQIHPVISRLCEPIEGTDAASIAGCLGLDPNKYARILSIKGEADEFTQYSLGRKYEERFKDCERFSFICSDCKQNVLVEGLRHKNPDGKPGVLVLERCSNPNCTSIPMDNLWYIQNQLSIVIRAHIRKYYEGWMICEDPTCGYRTRLINPNFVKGFPECRQCQRSVVRKEISSLALYNQLCYYQYLFDLKKDTVNIIKQDKDVVEAYKTVYDQVGEFLKVNGYSFVDLGALFSQLMPPVSS